MKKKTKSQPPFHKLYLDQLRDLYSAETQLTKALPKMAKAASSANLRKAFLDHLEETNGQIERLDKIFGALEQKPTGKKCAAMEGLIKEGKEVIEEEDDFGPEVTDAALIAAAQRVEHYEVSAYGSAKSFAEILGFDDAARLLAETKKEEENADKKLNELALIEINQRALESEETSEETADEESMMSATSRSRNRSSHTGHSNTSRS